MTGILARRRGMMQQKAAPSGNIPITGLTWRMPRGLASDGKVQASNTYKYSAFTGVENYGTNQSGAKSIGEIAIVSHTIRRTGEDSYTGYTINSFVHYYKNGVWQGRIQLYVGIDTSIPSDATEIALTFAFSSSSGQTMTQEIIDQCAGFEWV